MFYKQMVTTAIPERVYSLCKIVEDQPETVENIRQMMEPSFTGTTSYFNDYRRAAEELELIKISDNIVSLAVTPTVTSSMENMRKYINTHLNKFSEGQFVRVTHEFYAMGDDIIHKNKKIGDLALGLPFTVENKEILGWRFWSIFLGFGYLHDMYFIPNAAIFLKDLIETLDFQKGCKYTPSEFVKKIEPYAGIIFDDSIMEKRFNYGISNGLRTLNDLNIIKMEHIMDTQDIWTLYSMQDDVVTYITVL